MKKFFIFFSFLIYAFTVSKAQLIRHDTTQNSNQVNNNLKTDTNKHFDNIAETPFFFLTISGGISLPTEDYDSKGYQISQYGIHFVGFAGPGFTGNIDLDIKLAECLYLSGQFSYTQNSFDGNSFLGEVRTNDYYGHLLYYPNYYYFPLNLNVPYIDTHSVLNATTSGIQYYQNISYLGGLTFYFKEGKKITIGYRILIGAIISSFTTVHATISGYAIDSANAPKYPVNQNLDINGYAAKFVGNFGGLFRINIKPHISLSASVDYMLASKKMDLDCQFTDSQGKKDGDYILPAYFNISMFNVSVGVGIQF